MLPTQLFTLKNSSEHPSHPIRQEMNIIKTGALILLLISGAKSFAAAPLCQKTDVVGGDCAKESAEKVLPGLPAQLGAIEMYLWIESEIQTHRDVYSQKKDQFAGMYRYLENGKLDDKKSEPAVVKEIKGTKEDFETLFNISKSIRVVEARLQICYAGNCSAYKRVELEEQLAQIQKSKTLLLVKRPLLSHKSFEDFIKSQPAGFVDSEQMPTDKVVNDLMKTSSRETAKALLDKVDSFDRYINDPEAPLTHARNGAYADKYVTGLSSRHPQIADDLLSRFELISPPADKAGFLCALSTKRQKERERDALIKTGIETSLFVAPFLLGPWGRVGALGLEGALGTKLLRWGLTEKNVINGAWVARASSAVATNSLQSMEVAKIGETCKKLEQKYFVSADEKTFHSLSNCREEYSDSVFIASLGWVTAIAPEIPGPAPKFYKAKFTPQMIETNKIPALKVGVQLRNYPLERNQWAKEFKTPDQGNFTYMDLSKIDRVSDQHMKSLPDDYWKFVGDIYSERLNLTPEEIKGFIKSSQEYAPRTKLIINTSSSVKEADTFNGGVGVVTSGRGQDLLPLEKATGKKLDRKPGEKIVEIVRLTVSKDADAEKLSKSLINQALGAAIQDADVKFVYIYTSKIHSRLYRKFGVTQSNVSPLGDRDVLITLKRDEIERVINNTQN